uniref:Uncharacterized protein n=1 Tax=Romanomermis culicivorax TaxID=13658 RepID=A0A915HWE9_ROMCU
MHWEVDMQTCVRHSQKICMATERHRKTEMMMKNHLCLCYNFRPHANAQSSPICKLVTKFPTDLIAVDVSLEFGIVVVVVPDDDRRSMTVAAAENLSRSGIGGRLGSEYWGADFS